MLNVNVPKKPAYLTALMPRDEVFEVDIYEFNEPPNERGEGGSVYTKLYFFILNIPQQL